MLQVPPDQQPEYLRILQCFPERSAERMGWLIAFLATMWDEQEFPTDRLYFNISPGENQPDIQSSLARHQQEQFFDPESYRDESYRFEKLLLSLVQQGEVDSLRALLAAPPVLRPGKMSDDTLRQARNGAICVAAVVSRAAIEAGLDHRTAFLVSDLYIQKIELTRDIPSLTRLRNDIFLNYANRVRCLRYRTDSAGDVFIACAKYVAQNLYAPLRVGEVAAALNYSRSYLSSRFKQQTGMTLTHYILQEKIFESQRLLQFSDQSILDIANTLGFSSQSHFQNVFKSITGDTPMAFRKRAN